MTKDQIRNRIAEIGIIPAIRVSSAADALFAAEAVLTSGIPIVEVTMTVPGAIEVISELARSNSELVVGAGTLFDVETASRCLDAGAMFMTSPGLNIDIVEFGLRNKTVVFPGAMTPSEIMAAWKAGADFVKVFPCSVLGGPAYIKALKRPFPHVPLIASGGVNQQTAAAFIDAGAVALGIGHDLVQPNAIERREGGWIRELSWRYMKMVSDARTQKSILRASGAKRAYRAFASEAVLTSGIPIVEVTMTVPGVPPQLEMETAFPRGRAYRCA
jgi:2-dehydro-3-deoxyphosphogluconate aldolase/(4S)-4-hydroxy-2-oxoglutarate aldolase